MTSVVVDDVEQCTVLICDDQKVLRDVISAVVTNNPRFVVLAPAAVDGPSCVQRVEEARPDLLILDVNIPGGGPQVPRAVKAIDPGIFILVFSGRTDMEMQRDMLSAGADEFLVKTGRLAPLVLALNEAYEQIRAAP